MKIYGPVPSWRLKNSLGLDIFEPDRNTSKSCQFDCVYCNLKSSDSRTTVPKEMPITAKDIEDLKKKIEETHPDNITFAGACEPTLNLSLGDIAKSIKKITDIPLVLLTNSCYLKDKRIRDNAEQCDIIFAKLDAPTDELLKKINNPPEGTRIEDIISSIAKLRKKTYIQTLLFRSEKGTLTNSDDKTIDMFIETYSRINRTNPIEIYLGTVTRPPRDKDIIPLSQKEMQSIAEKIEKNTGIRTRYYENQDDTPIERPLDKSILRHEIISLVTRRPCTASQIESRFKGSDTKPILLELTEKGILKKEQHGKDTFYSIP